MTSTSVVRSASHAPRPATSDVVDAIVVATAVRHQAPVVTSDPDDLTRIADAIGVKLRIFRT
jgi:predicted nucleic acid-binding protein